MITHAFIFARGGSKGLPGKNIRPLAGIPLIGHSILMARQISCVSKIYVSTDCDAIAAVSQQYGAEVIRRPAELATDTASEWLAWQHAINYLFQAGEVFDIFLSLPTTSPLRRLQDVENSLHALDDATDAVITVSPAARNPYFNMVTRDSRGISDVVLRQQGIKRRQDAPEYYDMTTVAYVTRPSFILANTGLFDGSVASVIVPKEYAVDIDDAYDFMVAEALYEATRG